MARKAQISKNTILQAALEMLIEDGYASINIKTLSEKIGCSTQPLVWQFDNMEGLRNALTEYTVAYANHKLYDMSSQGVIGFERVGRAYVNMAVTEPNLFRFLFLNENNHVGTKSLSAIVSSEQNKELIKGIAGVLGIAEENAARYLQNTIIYAHGIATLVVTNVLAVSEEEMTSMINYAADGFLLQEGVSSTKVNELKGEEKE